MKEITRSFLVYLAGLFVVLMFLSITPSDAKTINVLINNLTIISVVYGLATESRFKIFNRNWISMFIAWLAFFGEPFGVM